MSWVARKVAGLDNEDQQAVTQEYLEQKQRESELKKFWMEYEDEYYNG